MITQLILDFLFGLFGLILGWLPTAGPPSWWADATDNVAQVWSYGASLGAWFPWALVAIVVPACFVALGIGLGIKVTRQVLSLFTAGGGSAG